MALRYCLEMLSPVLNPSTVFDLTCLRELKLDTQITSTQITVRLRHVVVATCSCVSVANNLEQTLSKLSANSRQTLN